MSEFDAAYAGLNESQRAAVEAIDGPVLVVAGPGTGKTQLLGMRVANILRRTDTDPSAILCLTFTNKAAANMRDRLLRLAGMEARGVMVKTFHSFAAEIMSMYPDYFWNGARLSAASDAVQLEIIESILGDLPLDNPLSLKFAGQFSSVMPVREGLKLAKEAGLTPDKLDALIRANVAYIDEIEPLLVNLLAAPLSHKRLAGLQAAINELPPQGLGDALAPLLPLDTVISESLAFAITQDEPTGKTAKTGKWKTRWIQSVAGRKGMFTERKRNEWWAALAVAYQLYREQLHTRGYYDYADMLVEVISAMEREPDLLAAVQERFLYVLIDEFQDTNAAQLRLSRLTADHFASDGRPNIMAVGDDDQSIYKFNGAELNNMLSFRRSYPGTRLFVLTDNYRSSQAVLDTSSRVIALAADRLVNREPDLDKTLRAVRPPAATGSIRHLAYPTRDHQLSHVARLLAAERTANPGRSIAVLARNHRSLRRMAGLLASLDVPVHYEQSNDALSHPAVQEVLTLARLVAAIQAGDEARVNELAARALRHPMWQLDPSELWRLAAANFTSPRWLHSLTTHDDTVIQNIGHWLLWLAAEADYQPLGVIIEYLLGLRAGEHATSPLHTHYLQGGVTSDYLAALSAVKLLQSLVQEFARMPESRLEDFVHFTDTMRRNDQVIADETLLGDRPDAIALYTVYKAKGLEFDSVYVIDAIEKNWQPGSNKSKTPANLPLQPHGEDADDYARLMYVALTRARHSICVASYRTDDTGADVLATPLVRSAIPDEEAVAAETAGEPLAVLEEALRWPRLPQADEQRLLASRLEGYVLSPTHLTTFLDVTNGGPAQFLESCLLRLPQARSAQAAFGSAMHTALERAQRQINAAGALDYAVLQTAYEQALLAERLPTAEFDRYAVHGQNVLQRLFGKLGYTLAAGSQPEQTLSATLPDGAELYGKLDRIDHPDAKSLVIVDYKSGTPLASFTTRDRTKAVKAWRHQTQLAFYALLALHSGRFRHQPQQVAGCIVYIEAEAASALERRYAPTPSDLDRLARLTQCVWQHVMQLNLPATDAYTPDIAGIRQFEQDLLDGKI